MKITHVDTFVVGTEWRNPTIVAPTRTMDGLGEGAVVTTHGPGRYLAEAAPISRRARPVQDRSWSRRWAATTSRAPAK